MKPLSSILGGCGMASDRAARQPRRIRLRVLNLTRQTVLATSLEVADSGPRRSKGLLGRARLAPGEGLWIIPCESVHTFFMQFPIDLVYLDRKHRIRKLRSEVPPWRAVGLSLRALRAGACVPGTIRSTQTQPGDLLEFSSATSDQ